MLPSSSPILVTGGAGYLGERVVAALLARGHRVRILDVVDRAVVPHTQDPRVEYLRGDLMDAADVLRAVEGAGAVVHLAARVVSRPLKDESEVAALRRLNHDAAVALAAGAKRAGVPRFVFASTTGCYTQATREAPAREDAPVAPVGPYAESKVLAERGILALADETFAPTVLRFATLFGASPRMNLEPLINNLVRDAVNDGKLVLFGPKAWRPFLHVDDAARAVRLVVEAPRERVASVVFNVGDDRLHATKEAIAREIQARLPNVDVVLDPRGDPRDFCVSFERVHADLGFRAQVTLEAGIQGLIRVVQAMPRANAAA